MFFYENGIGNGVRIRYCDCIVLVFLYIILVSVTVTVPVPSSTLVGVVGLTPYSSKLSKCSAYSSAVWNSNSLLSLL